MFRTTVLALAFASAACPTLPRAGDVEAKAGSAAWEARQRERLATFDDDGSGALDASEIRALPCTELRRMDTTLRSQGVSSFGVLYGVEPTLIWRGGVLGIAETARAATATRLAICLGPVAKRSEDELRAALLDIEAQPTTDPWDDEARMLLLTSYDDDASGAIDQEAEVERISCEIWQLLEGAAFSGRGEPFLSVYGVSEADIFVADSLGISESVQGVVLRVALLCQLAED